MSDRKASNEEMALVPVAELTYSCSYCNQSQDQSCATHRRPEASLSAIECIALRKRER